MTYDLRGSWDGVVGHHTGLFPLESQSYSPFNVDSSIRGWIHRGASPNKINLGIGTYGRSFTLENATINHIGAPTIGGGEPGPYSKSSGMLGYNEICMNIINAWKESWNVEQMVPYAYFYDQWVGYDNEKSIDIKVAYADLMNLGGIMVWSIETDDFHGLCGSKNPLLNQIRRSMGMN
nr:acidic mammalian chitinase-like [Onthophagus taurus]